VDFPAPHGPVIPIRTGLFGFLSPGGIFVVMG
jgi:hypothetical protein